MSVCLQAGLCACVYNNSKNHNSSNLTPSIQDPPGRGGRGNQLMYGPAPPRACFGISDDKILQIVASFY